MGSFIVETLAAATGQNLGKEGKWLPQYKIFKAFLVYRVFYSLQLAIF